MDNAVIHRVRIFLKQKKITNRDLSNMLSMRETTLNGKLNGTRGLDLDTLKSIITHFEDLSAEWLLRGEGEMLREKERTLVSVILSRILLPRTLLYIRYIKIS